MPSLKSATKPRARKGKAIPAKVEHEMTPAGFAEGVLGMNLYPWQKDTLNSLFPIHDRTYRDWETDRKSTRLNSSHSAKSRMPSSA